MCVFYIVFLCLYFFEGLFFVRCFRVSCVFFLLFLWLLLFLCVLFSFFAVSLGIVVFFIVFMCFRAFFYCFCGVLFSCGFVCVFGGAGVSLGVVVYLSFRAFLGVLFLRVSLAVVLALLFVNYVAGFLAFCRIYI